MRIEPGIHFANRYLIERQLSRGGTATVWLATDEMLSRRVAIKVVHMPNASLWREAKAAAVLDHPNIVTIYDVGEADGQPYIVMEYVPGRDLRRLLDEEAPLSAERAARLFLHIARAVAAIHDRHLIHRDLKPSNIIVTPTERVKIADFGIARMPGERPHGDVWGTPAYVAPEVLRGVPPTPAADVYSLGIILYEMLAGRHPFDAIGAHAMAEAHLSQIPPPITTFNPHVPPGLARFVGRLLEKAPHNRPEDARAVVEWLERYLDASTQTTRPLTGLVPSTSDTAPPASSETTATPPHRRTPFSTWLTTLLLLLAFGVVALGVLTAQVLGRSNAQDNVASAGLVATAPATPLVATFTPTVAPSPSPTATTVASPTASQTPPPPTKALSNPINVTRVPFAANTITVDGRLGEWAFTGTEILYPIEGGDIWQGVPDASGTIWLAWDNSMLYVGAYIRDDALVQRWKNDKLTRGDSLAIRLSPTSQLADVWEIALSPGDFDKRKPDAFITTGGKNDAKGVRVQAAPASDGYTLEAAIPWSKTPIGVPEQNLILRYAFVLHDNDDRNADVPQSRITNIPALDLNEPTTYPTLQLHPANQ